MYWLYGAYIVSIIVILLIELTKKNGISENGITKRQYYNPVLAFIYMCPLAYVAACRYRFWDTDDYRVMYEAVGKSFDNVFNNKYYYNQLDDCAKLIYDTIENNLYNMTAGNYEMKLSNEISDVLYEDNGEEKLDYSFQSAWDALTQDRTDTFFIDITNVNLKIKKTTYGNKVNYALSIAPDSNEGYLLKGLENKQTVHAVLNSIREQRDSIISNASGSDYDKILQVHDWIIDNLEYESNIENSNVYNLYGALIEKKAVCEGYAEAFKYILDEMRIPCILVSGTATNSEGTTERHEWNYVQIDNKWYAVDSTWDDPVVKGFGYVSNSVKHKYFLIGSRKINRNHFVNGQMTQNGQSFIYPKLESDNYK